MLAASTSIGNLDDAVGDGNVTPAVGAARSFGSQEPMSRSEAHV